LLLSNQLLHLFQKFLSRQLNQSLHQFQLSLLLPWNQLRHQRQKFQLPPSILSLPWLRLFQKDQSHLWLRLFLLFQ
jgi:hypothetical protein